MSILNHFGKVNYVPYKSKYENVGRRVLHADRTDCNAYIGTFEILEYTGFTTRKGTCYKCMYPDEANTKKTLYFDALKMGLYIEYTEWFLRPCMVSAPVPQRECILEDFPDIIKKITNKHRVPVLSSLNLPQMVTMPELLWLKVDDVDSRVDHLEKMLAQVIDDNKLLQEKVNALEQKHIRESRESRRVLIEELD